MDGLKNPISHLLICLVQHTIGLFKIFSLVVEFSRPGMVFECSLITKKADRRCAFEEVVFICWNTGRFLDDRFSRAPDERAVVPRAFYVSRDNKEGGRQAEAIHDRHGYAELINRSIIIGE